MSYSESHGPVEIVAVLSIPAEAERGSGANYQNKEPARTIVYRFEFETLRDAQDFLDTSGDVDGLLHAAQMEDMMEDVFDNRPYPNDHKD